MRTRKRRVDRRTVIEVYAKYDCPKKNHPIPDFATWNWSQPDAIDREMKCVGLKTGIPAGYVLWDEVEVTIADLRECAVDVNIFPGQPRRLGLVGAAELFRWTQSCENAWYKDIARGQILEPNTPMLLRPAVSDESPASWYIEDGSGRAVAFVANQHLFAAALTVTIGYLGRTPDPHSSIMRERFRELLPSKSSRVE